MKATKEQIIAEANRRRAEHGEGAPPVEHYIVDVVCENWTPPEPVDPDVLAFREWRVWTGHDPDDYEPLIGHAYMAGVRMAREQERERADMPIRMAKELLDRLRHLHVILSILDAAFAEKVEAEIAKYLEAGDQ